MNTLYWDSDLGGPNKRVLKVVSAFFVTISLFIVTVSTNASDNYGHHGGKSVRHKIGSFTRVHSEDESHDAFGIEYEYLLIPKWGAGLTYEQVPNGHYGDGITSQIAQLYYHPTNALRLVGGSHSHTESLTRVGVAYDFHLESFDIEPSINVDRVNRETIEVFGLAFMIGF